MSFLSQKFVTARKVHCCYWCGKHIQKGDTMERTSGVNSDGFWNAKLHPECAAARDATPYVDLVDGFYMEFSRGRTDAEKGEPMFTPDYRGRNQHPTQ